MNPRFRVWVEGKKPLYVKRLEEIPTYFSKKELTEPGVKYSIAYIFKGQIVGYLNSLAVTDCVFD